jgi:nitroreductase
MSPIQACSSLRRSEPADGTRPALYPLLARRRSPRAFDPDTDVTDQELALLLEAARWAPSNHNSQPWRFLAARRNTDVHKQILPHIAAHNQRWAGNAPLLLVGAHLTRSDDDRDLRYAAYDLGGAMAHLTIQATASGLYVHQMAGFDAAALHADLALPDDVFPKVVVAVGQVSDPAGLPDDLRAWEHRPRVRHPVSALLLPGTVRP